MTRSTKVRFRLSSRDLNIILPTLRGIVAADSALKSEGLAPFRTSLSALEPLVGHGGRVRFDHLELAVCLVCVRRIRELRKTGKESTRNEDALICRLERYRKRASRLCKRWLGPQHYLEARNGWADVVHHINIFHFASYRGANEQWSAMRRWYRTVVSRATSLASQGLIQRCAYPPPQPELRRMVRHGLRSIRRGRAPLAGVRSLLENPQRGRDFLATFLIKTRAEQLQFFDLGTVSAERAERLRNLLPAAD